MGFSIPGSLIAKRISRPIVKNKLTEADKEVNKREGKINGEPLPVVLSPVYPAVDDSKINCDNPAITGFGLFTGRYHDDRSFLSSYSIPEGGSLMNFRRWNRVLLALVIFLGAISSPAFASEEPKKIDLASELFREITKTPEKGIPSELLSNAYGLAIIPGAIKLSFIVSGRYGKGILMMRTEDGEWSNPCFITFVGRGLGWHIGAQSSDIILVFKNKRGLDAIRKGKLSLGVDAAVASGPVGPAKEPATETQLKADVYSYSYSKGIFAGVTLESGSLRVYDSANASFYGKKPINAADILMAKDNDSAAVKKLRAILTESAPVQKK